MPTNLTGNQIKDTYAQLLHVDGGPEATEKTVHSAVGVATALKVGTGSAAVDNIRFDDNTISTINTDGDLILSPNGTGSVSMTKVAITGGTITDITDLAVADGGTGASDASGARTNLGLGSIATQEADDVDITGGAISNVSFTGSFTGITLIESVSFQTVNGGDGLSLENTSLVADGTSTNIDISITPKGTGAVTIPKLEVTGSFGYAPTAGGSITQLTSKATGVTLNKPSGRITMHNAALNRNTGVTFVLTNSSIAATDVVIVNIASGATVGVYTATVDAVSAGSCRIHLHNHSTGVDYSEAVVLAFVVVKGTIT